MITGSRACASSYRSITITAELGYQAHTGSVGPTVRTTEPCHRRPLDLVHHTDEPTGPHSAHRVLLGKITQIHRTDRRIRQTQQIIEKSPRLLAQPVLIHDDSAGPAHFATEVHSRSHVVLFRHLIARRRRPAVVTKPSANPLTAFAAAISFSTFPSYCPVNFSVTGSSSHSFGAASSSSSSFARRPPPSSACLCNAPPHHGNPDC
jgi:hypothetical protein